ncbi:MAG: CYTH domain-containing protein, partial [Rhodospirillales bacterium]
MTDSSAAETELKLSIDPKKLKDIASVIPAGWVMSSPKTRKLINTYYDTDDLRFLKAGCSLRVRESGGRFIQTIKSDSGSDALHRRLEQNRELADNTITAPAIDDPKLAEQIGFLFPDDLVTIFSNRFERRSMELTCSDTGTLVEVAFDRGVVRSGRRQQPFAEVEIELLEGQPADLYRLAQQ